MTATNPQPEISTLTIGAAQIAVPTNDLFIAWLEKHIGAKPVVVSVPDLRDGEIYAGIIFGKDGAPDHRVFLLPGEREKINQIDSADWAVSIGGELPTRREQSLLFTNLKEHFQPGYYWSCEQHAANPDYAWGQYFRQWQPERQPQDVRRSSPRRPQINYFVIHQFKNLAEPAQFADRRA